MSVMIYIVEEGPNNSPAPVDLSVSLSCLSESADILVNI